MSFYFREKPRFGDKLRGKSRDELMEELRQQFDEKSKSFFEPTSTRGTRDPFERHTAFSRNFPFDDVDTFGRRRGSDIRSHLDDLASRHPEFADHLLGSAWGDIPAFHNTGSLRNPRRRRGSGSSSSNQGHQDEDARSHTSGSSANSAASGASGVSSHGGRSPNFAYNEKEGEEEPTLKKSTSTRRNPIPQYGLRNTVDIGQHRHEMENPVRTSENRGQRSMSAPPENRQQNEETSNQSDQQIPPQNPPQNQRFVSRVDITPQFVPPSSGTNEKPQKAQNSTNQQTKTQQSNVRHIPIFVEGRDEPVVPKNLSTEHDGPNWSSPSPPPPKFQQSQFPSPPPPPQFHRPSHFNQHYTGGRARDWLPSFDEEFYSHPNFPQSGIRRQQNPSHSSPFESKGSPPSQFRQRRNDEKVPHPQQQQRHHQQQQQPQRESQFDDRPPSRTNFSHQPEVPPEEPRKQTRPKDPLEKVAEVQKEVDSLNEQVLAWSGKSRKEKDYMYLDEMLTRELIKLDDIETEGRDEVRQARKNAIKSIQNSISLLESKAPLNGSHGSEATMDVQQDNGAASAENVVEESIAGNEAEKIEDEGTKTPIPLPAAPASPTKEPNTQVEDTMTEATTQEAKNGVVPDSSSQEIAPAEMDSAPIVKVPSQGSVDTRTNTEITKNNESTDIDTGTSNMETDNPVASPKTAKKIRKTKKQQQQAGPVSDDAIPLPGPEIH